MYVCGGIKGLNIESVQNKVMATMFNDQKYSYWFHGWYGYNWKSLSDFFISKFSHDVNVHKIIQQSLISIVPQCNPVSWHCKYVRLSHWGQVTHICISGPTWPSLVSIMARHLAVLSHTLNQCLNTVNCAFRNKIQWNFFQNSYISIHNMSVYRFV